MVGGLRKKKWRNAAIKLQHPPPTPPKNKQTKLLLLYTVAAPFCIVLGQLSRGLWILTSI